MQIKYVINKLERILNEKYPHIDINFYCSRKKKNLFILELKDQFNNTKIIQNLLKILNYFF